MHFTKGFSILYFETLRYSSIYRKPRSGFTIITTGETCGKKYKCTLNSKGVEL